MPRLAEVARLVFAGGGWWLLYTPPLADTSLEGPIWH